VITEECVPSINYLIHLLLAAVLLAVFFKAYTRDAVRRSAADPPGQPGGGSYRWAGR
jgi:hypothetical protein